MPNHVVITGGITRDAEIKSTPNGKTVANFSVADTRGWGDNQKSIFLDCVAWDKLAETAGKIIKKGKQVWISGSLDVRSWDDKNSGQKRYKTEIVVDNIQLLDRKDSGDRGSSQAQPAARPQAESAPRPTVSDDQEDW